MIDDMVAGELFYRIAHHLADSPQFFVAVGILLAILDDLPADHRRPFRDGDHRVVARVPFFVGSQHPGEFFHVKGDFGDQGAIHAGEVCGDQ